MSILIFPKYKDPLQGKSLDEFKGKLRELLKNRVNQVWLYGSLARGEATANSDIDIFIVTQTNLPFHERGSEFDDLRDFNVNIEPLVYTPAEWENLTKNPSIGFWQSAVREMLRLV